MCTLFRFKVQSHVIANDLLEKFSTVINNVYGGNRMFQVSMDESLNNWKFFNLLQKDGVEKEEHNFIDIGSCSLHIKHSAFKAEVESSGWNMKAILKGAKGRLYFNYRRRQIFFVLLCNTMGVGYSLADQLILGQHNQNC